MNHQADPNQDVRESLSAGIDGELSQEQLRFLWRRLEHDASLRQVWADYHVTRDGLRRQLPRMATAGFAARVMEAIDHEALPLPARRNRWLRWSAGGAIAASVAAAALMVGQPGADAEHGPTLTAQQVPSADAKTSDHRASMPAAVPPWLSGNAAGLLSQQASATLGSPFGGSHAAYAPRLPAYPSAPRYYRTLDNNDGSYLLLLDPRQSPSSSARQAATGQ